MSESNNGPVSAPRYSDQALAHNVAARFGDNYRLVSDTGQWLCWTGTTWEPDIRNAVAKPITRICCEQAAVAASDQSLGDGRAGMARRLTSDHTNRAVLSRLSKDPRIIVTSKELDCNPLLLGTPDGVVDLKTGETLPPRREDYITMSTSVSPAAPGTLYPLWDAFVASIFPKVVGQKEPDAEIIEFLQRWAGYSLTGLNTKHLYAFFVGRGRNGKGVLCTTLREIWGQYAWSLAAESLMERISEPHRQELAHLRGKRLVIADEIASGGKWNQARLNQLSGANQITANFMRQNSFVFDAVCKLWISTNTLPAFRIVDTAQIERLLLFWMRMRFLKSVAGHENEADVRQQNSDLIEQLKPERPAILRWAIEGASKALADGLKIPEQVRMSGESYLETEDELGAFVQSHCVALDGWSPLRELLEAWNISRREEGEKFETSTEFRKRIEVRYQVKHQNYGNAVFGLALNDFARAKVLRERERKERQAEQREATAGA